MSEEELASIETKMKLLGSNVSRQVEIAHAKLSADALLAEDNKAAVTAALESRAGCPRAA